MGQGSGIREVAWLDIAGGGQVVLDGNHAYIGHMDPPHGTSVMDVSDPANPRIVASIDIPPGLHSHKVRVANDMMVVQPRAHARARSRPMISSACASSTSANPASPRDICHWAMRRHGRAPFHLRRPLRLHLRRAGGLCRHHRHDPRPARIRRGRRRSAAGGWRASGPPAAKRPVGRARNHRCHHPIRRGDRLYVSYWYGGGVILDISDMTKPKLISSLDWSPPFGWPTHSLVPIDVPIAGHRWMLVADEHVQPLDPKLSPRTAGGGLDGEHHRRDAAGPGQLLPVAGTGRGRDAR